MATSFSRTLRSVRADRPARYFIAIVAAVVLLGAWAAWMVESRLAVYEATPAARLEVEQASHVIQSPVAGRVVALHLQLGREVAVGDVLVELDGDAQRLELEQAKARLTAIGPEIAAAKKELGAYEQAVSDDGQGVSANVAEARARVTEAEVAERHAADQVARAKKLKAEGLMSETELETAIAVLAQRRAATEAARMAVGRVGASGRADLSDRKAKKEGLAREIATLEGEAKTASALIVRLEHELSRRVIRASVAGRLAEIAPLTPGTVVREGERLGAIVPTGTLRIVAEYPPPRALGRIQVGQPARLRLEGFPWAQHGMVPAKVSRVASEVRDGRVRVELDVLEHDLAIPLQHGLPGRLEIEVERAAPYLLVLRAAGKLLEDAPPESADEPADPRAFDAAEP